MKSLEEELNFLEISLTTGKASSSGKSGKQNPCLRESHLADIAFVGFVASVCSPVYLQRVLLVEGLGTIVALERFVPRVNALVSNQLAVLFELLGTEPTRMERFTLSVAPL